MNAALAIAALLAASSAPVAQPQPKKVWVVNYADTFCSASRDFGAPGKPLNLVFRPSPRGGILQLFVIRNGYPLDAAHVPVTVSLSDRTVKGTALLYSPAKSKLQIALTTLPAEAFADAARTKKVSIRAGDNMNFDFSTPDMPKVMAALDTCNVDLQTMWNASDSSSTVVTTPAKPLKSLASYVSDDDYPSQSLREGSTGRSGVMILVDETGKPRDCLLEETSGNASLDAMTCIVFVKRAKFEPARNASGQPVKSVYRQSIAWRING